MDTVHVSSRELMDRWNQELRRLEEKHQDQFTQLPVNDGKLWFDSTSDTSIQVHYQSQQTEFPFQFRYATLHALATEADPDDIITISHTGDDPGPHALVSEWVPGQRLYATFATEVPTLGCATISGWKRFTVTAP